MSIIETCTKLYDDTQIVQKNIHDIIDLLSKEDTDLIIASKLLKTSTLTKQFIDILQSIDNLFMNTTVELTTQGLDTESKQNLLELFQTFEKDLSSLLSTVNKAKLVNLKQALYRTDEIKKGEENGEDFTNLDCDGKIMYATTLCSDNDCCDSCSYLRFSPDPDPTDPMRVSDQKAFCSYENKVIKAGLNICRLTNIPCPDFCPKISSN